MNSGSRRTTLGVATMTSVWLLSALVAGQAGQEHLVAAHRDVAQPCRALGSQPTAGQPGHLVDDTRGQVRAPLTGGHR